MLIVSIQLDPVQNFIKDKGVSYLQNKLKTKVSIGHISILFPKDISVRDVFIADQKGDTLLASHLLEINMDLPALIHSAVKIKSVHLDNFTSHITRTPDTTFNYNFILRAFSSPPEREPTKPDTSTMQIELNDIDLSNIHLSYQDTVTGYHVQLAFKDFHTRIGEFDLKKMRFEIKQFLLTGLKTKVRQENIPIVFQRMADSAARADSLHALAKKNQPQGPFVFLTLGKIELNQDQVEFSSKPLQLAAAVNLTDFALQNGTVDMGLQNVKISELSLSNTKTFLHFLKALEKATAKNAPRKNEHAVVKVTRATKKIAKGIYKAADSAGKIAQTKKSAGKMPAPGPQTPAAKGWKVDVNSLDLEHNELGFDNDNSKPAPKGMDFNHLHLTGLCLKTTDFHYEPAYIKVMLRKLELKDKSGFLVKKGEGSIYFDPHQVRAKGIEIQTGNSSLNATALLSYPSLDALSKTPGELRLDAKIDPSSLGLEDLLYFQPSLSSTDPFKQGAATHIHVKASMKGYVKDLTIAYFEASALDQTHLLVSGNIKGLPDPAKLNVNLNVQDLSTGSSDLKGLLSKGVIPASVHVPEHIKFNSKVKGNLANMNFDAHLKTSLGDVDANGNLRAVPHRDTAYAINLRAENIQAGLLSGQGKVLGNVSLHMNVKGSGLSLNRAHTTLSGILDRAVYQGYTYTNLKLNGSIKQKQIDLKSEMEDPNLSFYLQTEVDLRKRAPALTLQLNLDSIDFKALHFSKTTNKLHGNVHADIPALDINKPEADLKLTHFLIVQDSLSIPLDTVHLTAHTTGTQKHIRLESEFIKAGLDGEISFSDVADQITRQINHYYAFTKEKPLHKKYPAENFNFRATLLGPPSLHKLIPKLASFAPVILKGNYNSEASDFEFSISAPRIQYADISVDNLGLNLKTDANRLNYSLTVDSVSSTSFELQPSRIYGYAEDSKLHLNIGIQDSDRKIKYNLAGLFSEQNGNYQFHFQPDSLILNRERWTVSTDNLVEYGRQGILAHDMDLSHGTSKLSINSEENRTNAPIKVAFDHFDLVTLSKFIEKDSVLIRGNLNGQAVIDKLPNSPVFTSDLSLNDFSFKNDTLGTIRLKVDNQTANTYRADVNINGHGNDADLNGTYQTGTSSFDLNLVLSKLNLHSVEVYAFGQISHSKGYLSGNMKVTGSVSKPEINGSIGFNQVGFNLTYLNSFFNLPDQKIAFDPTGIHFSDFTLLDSGKNKLNLDGDILTHNYTDFSFDLNLSCNNFRVLNTTSKDNPLFYGRVYLNADIDITGDLNKPKIDANLTLNKQTNFTYIIPADDPSVESNKGIVEFMSFRNSPLAPPKKKRTGTFKGIDFSANLAIAKEAQFMVVIDPQTGDALKVQGEATLNTSIDPSGKVSLTGRYQIEKGSYQLTINSFIKKNFTIKQGSTITWTGDPTSADVDLTAVYTVNAPSIDLMEQQTSDQSELNQYKNQLPFLLNLMMKGELLKPVITFSIDLSENDANLNQAVKNVLDNLKQDPSELNKQVFALLVLGRFVGQNPLQAASGGGLDAGLLARQSAGKILSQQLNKLAGNLIKGVDLNFGLNSSESYSNSGQQTTNTTLQVGATKKLNDRISVSVGSDIALEGASGGGTSSTLIGDVNVEYKISRDGRYRLRAFRRNATEEYVEGEFIETGLSFLFVLDYNQFREIFQKNKQVKSKPVTKVTKASK